MKANFFYNIKNDLILILRWGTSTKNKLKYTSKCMEYSNSVWMSASKTNKYFHG